MDSDKSNLRVPFDGKEENYPMWAEKFKSLCVVKGCVSVLLQDLPIPKDDEFVDCELDPLSETPDTDKKAIQLK